MVQRKRESKRGYCRAVESVFCANNTKNQEELGCISIWRNGTEMPGNFGQKINVCANLQQNDSTILHWTISHHKKKNTENIRITRNIRHLRRHRELNKCRTDSTCIFAPYDTINSSPVACTSHYHSIICYLFLSPVYRATYVLSKQTSLFTQPRTYKTHQTQIFAYIR